jgi:uncharacterized protein YkwD
MQALANGILVQLNRVRVAHGLAPLTISVQLSQAAREHTSEMLIDGYFAHNSFNGAPFWKRFQSYVRQASHGSWDVSENLLWSSSTIAPAAAVKLWMASPEHRATILSHDCRQIGISALHADSAPGEFGNQPVTVVTADFGIRS